MSSTPTNPWFVIPKPQPSATLRLICMPYAGSGPAAFRPWATLLPAWIELCIVQLPGRESRWREVPYSDMDSLIDALTGALLDASHPTNLLDRPFALFGHSMGALVAFELARALQRRKRPAPAHLLVSGRRAPQINDPEPPFSPLSDDEFVHEIIRRYNAIPKVILDDTEMLRLFLPTLRADMAVLEAYTYADAPQLDCPITAFGGVDDARAGRSDLAAWRAQTRDSFQLRQFPGDHFYLNPQREALVKYIVEILAASD